MTVEMEGKEAEVKKELEMVDANVDKRGGEVEKEVEVKEKHLTYYMVTIFLAEVYR